MRSLDPHLAGVGSCGIERSLRLLDACLRGLYGCLLRLGGFLCGRQLVLRGLLFRGGHARRRQERVELLFRDLFLLDQRSHAGQVSLRAFIGRALGLDVRARRRHLRIGGLLVRSLGPLVIGLRRRHLSRRADGAAGRGCLRQWDSRLCGLFLALGQRQRGPGLSYFRLVIARIDAHQDLSGLHALVIGDQHFEHVPRHLRRDRHDVAVHLRVIG